MADIFISYANEDFDRVVPLAKALENQGWSVFWDRKIPPGRTWDDIIEEAIEAAKCIIVVWTKESVNSGWVRAEAQEGLDREILVPVKFEEVKIPLRFRPVQAANFIGWEENKSNTGFMNLRVAITDILGFPPVEEEERRRKEAETRIRAEEGRKKTEAEAKRKADEELKHREEKPKLDKPEPDKIRPAEPKSGATPPIEPKSPESTKKSNVLKFGAVACVIILLLAGGWFYYKYQQEQQEKETRIKIERFYEQIEELERSVADVENQEQLKKLYEQTDKLSRQADALSEHATKVGVESKLADFENRLKQIQIQLTNKGKELIAARKGKIFVEPVPDNAMIKILNIDQDFRQGIELEPGKYHVQVSSEGYEPQDRWIEIGASEEKRIDFELEKILPKVARLFVETLPKDATVRILNIKPKFFQGIELDPGDYHVEVAAGGYETERRWIAIIDGNEEPVKFELKKIKVAELISPQKTITNTIGMKFIKIPAGSFTMGSKLSPDELVQKVTINKAFYLQSTEVTQGHWKAVMKNNPSHFKECGDECPVERVSWEDAKFFINKLNKMEGGEAYRLPTEAEWEYAVRAGTTTLFSFGDDDNKLTYYAWYFSNSESKTHRVKTKEPNPWGLYDMHGNVWEWVEDDRHDNYVGAPDDGRAWVDDPRGADRVIRGGSWNFVARWCRSASRIVGPPDSRNPGLGFRLARSIRADTQIIEPSFSVGHVNKIMPSLKLIIVKLDTLIANNTKIFIKNKGGHKIFLEPLEMDEKFASFKLSDNVYGIAIGDVVYTER